MAKSPGNLEPTQIPKAARLLQMIVLVVTLCVAVCTFLFFARVEFPGDSGEDLPITDQLSDIGELPGQAKWKFRSLRDRIRCDLIEMRQDVDLVWENIDKLKEEITKFDEVYEDVATSKHYPELLKDEFAVRYFAKDIKDPLPHVKTPIHCAERLNVLMYTVNRALAKKRAAFEVEYQTRDRIETLEGDVSDALNAYLLHREFLEALRALTAAGALPEAETLLEAAHQRRLEMALEKMGHPDALREEYRSKPEGGGKKKRASSAAD